VKPSDRVFARVLNERKLTHHQLVAWASDPNLLLHAAAELLGDDTPTRRLGDTCPLCGFSTYDWYEFVTDRDMELAAAIQGAQPAWHSPSGACRQCVETYASGLDGNVGSQSCSMERSLGGRDESRPIHRSGLMA
jgi:hypothetical protein